MSSFNHRRWQAEFVREGADLTAFTQVGEHRVDRGAQLFGAFAAAGQEPVDHLLERRRAHTLRGEPVQHFLQCDGGIAKHFAQFEADPAA